MGGTMIDYVIYVGLTIVMTPFVFGLGCMAGSFLIGLPALLLGDKEGVVMPFGGLAVGLGAMIYLWVGAIRTMAGG